MSKPSVELRIEDYTSLIDTLNQIGYNEFVGPATEYLKKEEFKCKEARVHEVHHHKITRSERIKNGKPYTFFITVIDKTGKSMRCATYEALIEKLYVKYFGEADGKTIEYIYKKWIGQFKKSVIEGHRSIDTLRRYEAFWKKYYMVDDIIHKDVDKIKRSEFKAFFSRTAAGQCITRKELNNVKSLLNHIYDYCIDHDLNMVNVRAISTRDLNCKDVLNADKVYTDEERAKIMRSALLEENRVYARAIRLQFNLGARVGEIKALKWSDIDFEKRTIFIHAEVINTVVNDSTIVAKRVEHTKSKMESGNRVLVLNDTAIATLRAQRAESPFSEYVFMYHDDFLTTDQYNKVLKRICNKAKVRFLSSHKIRFWAVTKMYENGVVERDVQRAAGHANNGMTGHYDRGSRLRPIDMKLD